MSRMPARPRTMENTLGSDLNVTQQGWANMSGRDNRERGGSRKGQRAKTLPPVQGEWWASRTGPIGDAWSVTGDAVDSSGYIHPNTPGLWQVDMKMTAEVTRTQGGLYFPPHNEPPSLPEGTGAPFNRMAFWAFGVLGSHDTIGNDRGTAALNWYGTDAGDSEYEWRTFDSRSLSCDGDVNAILLGSAGFDPVESYVAHGILVKADDEP